MPQEKKDEANTIILISDILDKLITAHQASAEANMSLSESVNSMKNILIKVEAHFTNGFRSDIKNHIDITNKEMVRVIESDKKHHIDIIENLKVNNLKIQELIDTLSKPWFWIKVVGATTAAIGSIAGLLALLLHKYAG